MSTNRRNFLKVAESLIRFCVDAPDLLIEAHCRIAWVLLQLGLIVVPCQGRSKVEAIVDGKHPRIVPVEMLVKLHQIYIEFDHLHRASDCHEQASAEQHYCEERSKS